MFEKFRPGTEPPAKLGESRDYNIDLMPKFIMASGKLVKMLIHTDVTKYLEFKSVEGSYVFKDKAINKVPATAMEAAKTPLVGFFEKKRVRSFLQYVQEFADEDPKTHKSLNLKTMTSREFMKHFSLDESTFDFIGHAMALYSDESYLDEPAIELLRRIRLYGESLDRYGKSPYIYPLYGLGELPQAFARLSAVFGGTYMLNTKVDEIIRNDKGEACGIVSNGQYASCKFVVGDPSYFPDKVRKVGRVVRAICILSHPITPSGEHSAQIIIPQKAVGRRSDIYIFNCSYQHQVAAQNKFLAFVSTVAETDSPQKDLQAGLDLLGTVDELFFDSYDLLAPVADGTQDKTFISKSYDPSSHFEATSEDVLDLYKRITGQDLDLSHQRVQHESAE